MPVAMEYLVRHFFKLLKVAFRVRSEAGLITMLAATVASICQVPLKPEHFHSIRVIGQIVHQRIDMISAYAKCLEVDASK